MARVFLMIRYPRELGTVGESDWDHLLKTISEVSRSAGSVAMHTVIVHGLTATNTVRRMCIYVQMSLCSRYALSALRTDVVSNRMYASKRSTVSCAHALRYTQWAASLAKYPCLGVV